MNQNKASYPVAQQPPLPDGWQLFVDSYGRPFYWNTKTKESSWTPPVDYTQYPMPTGWEKATDATGRTYYIDHASKQTSWEDPRPAFYKNQATSPTTNVSPVTSTSASPSNPPSSSTPSSQSPSASASSYQPPSGSTTSYSGSSTGSYPGLNGSNADFRPSGASTYQTQSNSNSYQTSYPSYNNPSSSNAIPSFQPAPISNPATSQTGSYPKSNPISTGTSSSTSGSSFSGSYGAPQTTYQPPSTTFSYPSLNDTYQPSSASSNSSYSSYGAPSDTYAYQSKPAVQSSAPVATSPYSQNLYNQSYNPVQPVASNANTRLIGTKPQWDTAVERPNCQGCGIEFTFFKRRHHCRCCSGEFCDVCSVKRHAVPSLEFNEPVRVCEACDQHLKVTPDCVPRMIPYLMTQPPMPQLPQAVREVCSVLMAQERGLMIDLMTESKVTPPLFDILKTFNQVESSPSIQPPEALAVLKVFTRATDDLKGLSLLKSGDLQTLVGLLSAPTLDMKKETALILSKIVKDDNLRTELKTHGALNSLLEIIENSSNEGLLEYVTEAVQEFSVHFPQEISAKCHVFLSLLASANTRILLATTSTLEVVVEDGNGARNLFETGAITALLNLLRSMEDSSKRSAVQLRALKILQVLSMLDGAGSVLVSRDNNTSDKSASGVHTLMSIVSFGGKDEMTISAAILEALLEQPAYAEQTEEISVEFSGVETIIRYLGSDVPNVQRLALSVLKGLASRANPVMEVGFRESNGPMALIQILAGNSGLLPDALATMAAVVYNSTANGRALLEIGALPILLDTLNAKNSTLVQARTVNCLAAMCEDENTLEGLCTGDNSQKQMLNDLVNFLRTNNMEMVHGSLRLLGTLFSKSYFRNLFIQSAGTAGMQQIVTLLAAEQQPEIQFQAIRCIGNLTEGPSSQDEIRNLLGGLGCLDNLLNSLSSPDLNLQQIASQAFINLCKSYQIREIVFNMGAIPSLVALLSEKSSLKNTSSRRQITEILAAFSFEEKSRATMKEAGILPILTDVVFSSPDEHFKMNAVMALSNFAVSDSEAVEVTKLGGHVGALSLLNLKVGDPNSEKMAGVACQFLANLAKSRGCHEFLIQDEVVSALLKLVDQVPALSESPAKIQISNGSINALAMMAANPQLTKLGIFLEPNSIQPIVKLLKTKESKEQAVYILLNLWNTNPELWKVFVTLTGVSGILEFLQTDNQEAVSRILPLLSALLTQEWAQQQLLAAPMGVSQMVKLLNSNLKETQMTALTILATVVKLPGASTVLIEALPAIVGLYGKMDDKVNSQLTRDASVILAEFSRDPKLHRRLVDSGVLPKSVELLFSNLESSFKLNVLNLIFNLSDEAEQINELGGIHGLITCLNNPELQSLVISTLATLAGKSEKSRYSLISNEGLEPIIPFLSSSDPQLKEQALYIVEMISRNPKVCESIERLGGLEPLIAILLEETNTIVQVEESANLRKLRVLSIVANVSGISPKSRVDLVKHQILNPVKALLWSDNVQLENVAIEIISNLSVMDECKAILGIEGTHQIFNIFFTKSQDQAVRAGKALINLTLSDSIRKSEIPVNFPGQLLNLTASNVTEISVPAIRIIENLIIEAKNRQIFEESGLVQVFTGLLDSQNLIVVSEILSVIRSFPASGYDLFKELAGLQKLVKLLSSCKDQAILYNVFQIFREMTFEDENRRLLKSVLPMDLIPSVNFPGNIAMDVQNRLY
eukprot:TRINITY_DN266_c5_g1_i1.p1 TRINITY_DN266_c5_g1~~TRINITY_DN266_c5_g1_i1.p1  ORF type:complete len:1717 (+),score=609.32 TRINITY_DN266_c5_g1_i1:56-5206(+)